jgi:HupF/HypC family
VQFIDEALVGGSACVLRYPERSLTKKCWATTASPEAHTGDFVLVHVGFAISKVDEEEADRAYKLSIFTFLAATGAHGELRHGVFGRS